jgi:hypothetical protein
MKSVFDMDVVRDVEQTYRHRIEKEPVDTGARLRLAWCLVMRAFHEAGREEMAWSLCSSNPTRVTVAPTQGDDHGSCEPIQAASLQVGTPESPGGSSRCLLAGSLRQASMVLELSTSQEERREAVKLRELIRLSGAQHAITAADDESEQVLSELTRDILSATDNTDVEVIFDKRYYGPDLLA